MPQPTRYFPDRHEDARLRVATFNIWGWFGNWPERAALLYHLWDETPLANQPDVLLLQEGCYSLRSDQTQDVVNALGYKYWLHALGVAPEPHGEGVAVASRLPFLQARTFPLPASEPGRTIAIAWIEPEEGHRVCCISAHAAYAPERVRDQQIKAICNIGGNHIIIGGDLNATPDRVSEYLIGTGLTDSLANTNTNTWPIDEDFFAMGWSQRAGHQPDFSLKPKRLDYLLSRGCRVLATGAVSGGDTHDGFPSDHALVWADYDF